MMTPEALSALRDRLIAATGPSFELDRLLTEVTGYPNVYRNDDGTIPFNAIVADFTSSVDAALGLVSRLLPGKWPLILDTAMATMWATESAVEFSGTTIDLRRLPVNILLALVSALSQPGVQS